MLPDNSITRKITLQTNIIGALYENYHFLKKNPQNVVSDGRDNCFYVITLLEKKLLKKHFGNIIYTRRGPVYHKFVDVCQYDICKKYVKKSF